MNEMDEEKELEMDQIILDQYEEMIWCKVWTIYMGGYDGVSDMPSEDRSHIHLQRVS